MVADYNDQSDFSVEFKDGVCTLTFTRPNKANAFNPRAIAPMHTLFTELGHRPDIRVVLIRGEGKHFMAGGDLETISGMDESTPTERTIQGEQPIQVYNSMIRAMQRLDKPVVAAVQGGVAGAGMGFIGSCDLVIAADDAFFWAAHILHGGSNDGLLTYFMPRHIGLRKALEMALMGDRIKAQEAKELGLVNWVVPRDKFEEETDKLVARLAKGPTLGYGKIKKLMYASFNNSMMEQGLMEAESYGQVINTADVQDGLKAFFEKREPNFKGQ